MKLLEGKVSGLQCSAGSLWDLTRSVLDLPLSHVGTVTSVRQKKRKFARFFSEMEEIPVGSHGPPKPVSNGALFRWLWREQPCARARAALALLSALGIGLFGRLGIQNMTGQIYP